MTKEEKEAINNIKVFIRSIRSDLTEESEDNQKLANDIETLLSMLKEKEAEIEKLKKDFKIVDEECSRLERKEAKQDKIIEVMTLFMSNLDIDEEICKHQVQAFCDNKPEGVTLDVCAKCIKQYFEKQAKEKGE